MGLPLPEPIEPMRTLPWILPILLAAPAAAQSTYLTEDFESGAVPPTGWQELNNGNNVGWEPSSGNLFGTTEAWHDDFTGWNDNTLVSPQMDLSAASAVFAHCSQYVWYASWRDHHFVHVSLDNGVTFINIVDDLAGDGVSDLTADISAYGGVNGVNVAYQYTGDYASEWSIDNVVVNDSSTPPPPPPPAILTTLVNPANGHTYHLLDVSNWSLAEATAVSLGGHLATVDDAAENTWIETSFGNWGGLSRTLWIGLNDVALEGTFVWADGTPVGYTNWNAGEPNNSTGNDPVNGEDHVMIYGTGGTWNDLHDTHTSPWFPNICGVVEIGGPPGPALAVNNLVAGGVVTIAVSNATSMGTVRHGYSLYGGGPVTTPYGDLLLSPPYTEFPAMVADANGDASLSVPVPAGTTGVSVWFHAIDLGSLTFTNGVAAVIG